MTYESTYKTASTLLDTFTLPGGETVSYTYDSFDRLSHSTLPTSMVDYGYESDSTTKETSNRVSSYLFWARFPESGMSSYQYTIGYTYDANGNITEIKKNNSSHLLYEYDSLGQLTRESSYATLNYDRYTYDDAGNRLSKNTYYWSGTLKSGETYGYTNSTWGDLLTNYNGTTITYDASGNPTKWKNASNLYWKGGRLTLVSLEGTNANEVSFSYNSAGIRTKKHFAGGAGMVPYYTDVYTVDGSRILSEVRTDDQLYTVVRTLYYIYDASGSVIGMEYNGAKYWYDKNLQGDIVGIRNASGTLVAQYVYDAWGKILQITDKDGNDVSGSLNHIANINPFRYRGYYYDVESGFYYVSSRYYDPEVGRFISPEPNVAFGEFDEGAGLLGYNVYAYCANNPVMYKDETGESITLACVLIFGGVGLLAGGHYAAKASKARLGYVNGWWVLGGMVVGGGVGALLGWGVGSAATAIGVKLAAGSGGTLGTVIYSSWQKAEQALRSAYHGIVKTFSTPWGNRIVDSYSSNKIIREAKYGYQSLSQFIQKEINKDAWLLQNKQVKAVEWHFYWSSISNSGGPSGPLLKELARRGIKVIFH